MKEKSSALLAGQVSGPGGPSLPSVESSSALERSTLVLRCSLDESCGSAAEAVSVWEDREDRRLLGGCFHAVVLLSGDGDSGATLSRPWRWSVHVPYWLSASLTRVSVSLASAVLLEKHCFSWPRSGGSESGCLFLKEENRCWLRAEKRRKDSRPREARCRKEEVRLKPGRLGGSPLVRSWPTVVVTKCRASWKDLLTVPIHWVTWVWATVSLSPK